ncbi:MAG: radical SAM protein [Bacilli bacterium]|jgi:hypothetical protein|nr:radical SAM protein [Bacilli bacterium]
MKETTIRIERYGVIIYVPQRFCYYNILDEKLADMFKNRRIDDVKTMFSVEYKLLCLDKNEVRYVDNSEIDSNTFVPLEAYFDYTSKCNMHCSYCYNRDNLNDITMPKNMVKKVFDDFYDLGIMRVHLAGGEPTIDYEGLKNYLEYGNSKNMHISIATNGSMLNDDICELLTKSNLISVSISIDSSIEEINDVKRGKQSFKRAYEGIIKLLKYKYKNHSNIEICIKPVFSFELTRKDIYDMLSLSEKLKIDKLKFSNPERCEYHSIGYYGKNKSLYYENIRLLNDVIKEYAGSIKITTITNPASFDFDIGIAGNKGCIGGQELITINPNGSITPCLMNHYNLGSVYDYANLKEFLETSEKLLAYKKMIYNEACDSCKSYSGCRGGCQVRKKVEYGEIKGKDPLCINFEEKTQNSKKVLKRVNIYHSL